MKADYQEENIKVKRHSLFVCICVFMFGLISALLCFFLYPNDILCNITSNKYLCNKKICNQGFFGSDCLECKICINGYCDGSGTITGTGKCICNKGWSGKLCDTCDNGYYGSNCSICSCVNGICDNNLPDKCICHQPYVGNECNKCLYNYYGVNCTKKCTNINCLENKCNNDGSCKKCTLGYTGKDCDKCDKYYKKVNNQCITNTNLTEICRLPDFGYSMIENKYGLCKSCPKNNYGILCSGHGTCNGKGTVFGDGKCKCNTNYTGQLCQYHGIMVNNSNCLDGCSNNGNCILHNDIYSCNCIRNYTGTICNKCDVGMIMVNGKCQQCKRGSDYYGKFCQKCNCNNGICNDGFQGDGLCSCYNGFTGLNCNTCLDNYYGNNCTKCRDCNDGLCSDGKMGNGKCICKIGYSGAVCNMCSDGFILNNYHCEECPGSMGGKQQPCSGNGKCSIRNNKAICSCNTGYDGESCYHKIVGNCSEYNYCNMNGNCIEGECYCTNNLYGDYCNETYISYLKKYNLSESYYVVKTNLENNDAKKNIDTGDAIGISILIVFLFIGCFVGTAWYIKYKPNPIKNYTTRLTATKKIELTEEEKKYCTINPIFNTDDMNNNYFVKAMSNLKTAVGKDNGHYFEEAITYYNLGIDLLMNYMKGEINANTRFQMAKKIDIYVKRVVYLKRLVENKNLINDIQKPPLAPVITN